MDTTQTILKILASGGAWSHDELQAKTGISVEKIRNAMHVLRRRGHQAIEPNRYVATEAGKSHFASTVLREQRIAASRAAKALAKEKAKARLVLTEEEREAKKAAWRDRANAKKREQRIAEKERATEGAALEFVHRFTSAAHAQDSIVSTAMEKRPAIQAVWGAMA